MTRYQSNVLWLGLILIGLNLIVHIKDVKAVLFSAPSSKAPTAAQQNAAAGTNADINSVIQGILSGLTAGTLSATKPMPTPPNNQVVIA